MWSEDYGSSFSSKNPLPRGIDRDPSAPLGNVQLSQITINALFTLINLKSGAMDFFFNGQQKKKSYKMFGLAVERLHRRSIDPSLFFTFCSRSFTRLLTEKITGNSQTKVLCQELRIKKKKRSSPGRNNWLLYVDDNPLAHCRSRAHTHAYTTNTNRFSLYLTLASMCCRLIKAR